MGAVYALVCAGSGRRVLKGTVDIGGIRGRFEFAKRIGSCPDPVMNREFSQYGADAITMEVLEELTMKEGQTGAEFAEDIDTLLEMWREKTQEGAQTP